MKKEIKRIAVLGAGAVGCFFGGMLARSGKDVLLIARENHVQAIKKNGLFMECQSFQEYVHIDVSSNIKDIASADLVLCCVKSPDTENVMHEIKSLIKPDALILSLQNGVDNTERMRRVISNAAIPTVVYVATSMGGDGHVKHFGRGELIIGELNPQGHEPSELQQVTDIFLSANIPCVVSSNIRRELWLKFLVNCSYNAISAIGQITYGEMVQQENIRQLIGDLTTEFLLVAKQEKVDISAHEARMINEQIAQTMAGQRSSTAQDLMRRKPTEIDYLNGLIVRLAESHGVSAPAHRVVYALVKMLEHQQLNTQK